MGPGVLRGSCIRSETIASVDALEYLSFVREGLGNSSYLLFLAGRRAVLVDPDRTADRYVEAAAARGWEIAAVLETHLHADFVTGSLEIREATAADVYLPTEARAGFPHCGLAAGDRVQIVDVEVEAIASPGHTPEHLSYVVRRSGSPPLLLSGGALIVGGAARTDLIAPDLTEELTRAEFRTLRGAFRALPDETILLPTHGAGSFCSVGSGGDRTSTLGRERAANPLLLMEDEEEFVRWFPTTFPGVPSYFSRMRPINQAGPRLRRDIDDPPPLSPEEFELAQRQGAVVVDVRQPSDFAEAHVPHSIANPWREAYATWLGWVVEPDARLLFVTDGVPIEVVVDESLLVGYERFAGYLDGGIESWDAAGKQIALGAVIDVAEAAWAIQDGAAVLDVREPGEFESGHLPEAVHIPLGELASRLGELPRGRPIVTYCGSGARSTTAASLLERAGIGPALNLEGGFGAWRKAGNRVSRMRRG